jgi:hypothetical protein
MLQVANSDLVLKPLDDTAKLFRKAVRLKTRWL